MDNQKELGFSIKILGTDAQLSELAKIEAKLRATAEVRKIANDTIKEGEKLQKQLTKELAMGVITQDEYEVGMKQLANTNKEALNTVAASQLATKQLNKEKHDLTNTIQLETKVSKEQATSYNALSAQYSLMKKQINAMTVAERENTEAGRKLVAESKKIRDQMNSMQQATGNSSLNVGKYSEALQGASGVLGAFGGQLSQIINRLVMMSSAMKQMAAGSTAAAAAQDTHTAATSRGAKALRLFRLVAAPVLLVLGALVGLFVSATRKGSEFSKELSGLRAILGDMADEASMDELSEQALKLGGSTEYTAVQVVSLQTELAKLGFSIDEILNSTGGILSLATALDTSLPNAAELTGSTLRAFGLEATETGRVTDILAKSAMSSALNYERLVESLKLAIPAARALNVPIEDTVGLLGVLADNGIRGSLAGTGLQKIFIELNKKGITLNQAMERVGNSTNQLNEAIELVGDRGGKSLLILANNAPRVDELTKSLYDAEGAAQKMAEIRLDNLAGDTTKLKSAWEGFLLTVEDGSGVLNNAARKVVQVFTQIVQGAINVSASIPEQWNTIKNNISSNLQFVQAISKSVFGKIRGNLLLFAANAKLIISEIPILGEAIDKKKAEEQVENAKFILYFAEEELKKARDIIKKKQEYEASEGDRIKTRKEKAALAQRSKEVEKVQSEIDKKAQKEAEKAAKKLEEAEKNTSKLLNDVREGRIRQMTDGIEKEQALLNENIEQQKEKLREQLASEQDLASASGKLKQELLKSNQLINERILQLELEKTKGLDEINQKYADKTSALRLKELDQHQTLEELAIRNKVINNHLTKEEGEKAILEIKKDYLTQKLALIDTETEEGKIKYQELVNAIDEINNPVEGEKTGLAQLFSITDEEAEKLKSRAISIAQDIANQISEINAIERENNLKNDLDNQEKINEGKVALLDDRLEKGLITQEQYNAAISRQEQEYDNKREEIERAAFERNKKASINAAFIAGSLAILNVLATNKGGAIARLIEAGYVIGQTAFQIAKIKKQEYAEGGIVFSGQRIPNSAKNISTRSSGDNVAAYVRTGEVVLNRSQQAALGGASTFAAIGVPGFASGGMVPPNPAPQFNSRQLQNVAKLDDGQLKEMFGYMGSLIDTKIQNLRVSEYEVSDTQSTVSTIEQENTF